MRTIFISAFAASCLVAVSPPVTAIAAEEPEVTSVLKAELPDLEREANIVVYDVPAGWQTERHIHPGHVFVYVTDGQIEIDVEGGEPQLVSAGGAVHELPHEAMIGRNASSSEPARFVVFQVGPPGEPLMVAQPK